MRTLTTVLFVSSLLGSSAALMAQQTFTIVRGSSDLDGPVILGAQMVGRPLVTGAPYSAEAVSETTQALSDGNRIETHSTAMRYRDSKGRERREEVLPGVGTSAIFISDPVAGVSYMLDQKTHEAHKTGPLAPPPPPPPAHDASLGVIYPPLTAQKEILKGNDLDHGASVDRVVKGSPAERAGTQQWDVNPAVDGPAVKESDDLMPPIPDAPVVLQDRAQVSGTLPSTGPSRTENLGTATIEGVSVEGKRTTLTIPAGEIGNKQPIEVTSETWYSPDLQTVISVKHSDPRTGDSAYRLTNVSRTEQPAYLFEVPSDYKVVGMQGK